MDFENIISKRSKKLDGSAIRKASEYASKIQNPVNLTIGQPDFNVDISIKQALFDAVNNNKNGYCKTVGIDILRQTILEKKKLYTQDIIITAGVTAGISLGLLTCLDVGDELLIPDPYFLQYAEIIKLLGIKPIFIDTYPNFKISLDMIEEKITPKTKGIILNSPNNPTGQIIENSELIRIITYLSNKNIMIFYDEIYSDFNYKETVPINLFEYGENIILLNGFSKSYAITGWRLGYAIAHPRIIERMTRIQGQLYVSPASIVQYAALAALNLDISQTIQQYKKRTILVKENISPVFGSSQCDGGFYFFLKSPASFKTASNFCKIAAQNSVLLVPGCAFSQKDTHFRLSICTNEENLSRGIKILNNLVNGEITDV